MHKAIQAYLADLLPVCSSAGLLLTEEREIAFGVQLRFSAHEESIVLNVYHSEKRGLSTVITGNKDNPLRILLESCLFRILQKPEPIAMHDWQTWIGSDECGKGDYFGAPVVGCFYMKDTDAEKLISLGVCDSKLLKDSRIETVAKQIYATFPQRSSVIALKPSKYNQLYADFASKKKNINDLLAWQHVANIDTVLKSHSQTQGVIIDQFSYHRKASWLLSQKYPSVSIIERPGAEADLAVAAASILARYQFIQQFRAMSKYFKMDFPMGAGNNVITTAREFVEKYGFDRLGEVAKLHFKTTIAVRQTELPLRG